MWTLAGSMNFASRTLKNRNWLQGHSGLKVENEFVFPFPPSKLCPAILPNIVHLNFTMILMVMPAMLKRQKIWQLVGIGGGVWCKSSTYWRKRILWLQVWEKELSILDLILSFSPFGSSCRNLILCSSTVWILWGQPVVEAHGRGYASKHTWLAPQPHSTFPSMTIFQFLIWVWIKRILWAARVAQWFSTAFSPGPDAGDLESSSTSGSLHGACFSLCLCLSVSVMNN